MCKSSLASALLIFWLSCVPCTGQEPASRTYTISDNVDLVVLDVNVRNATGSYVRGLDKNDFRVFEDHVLRRISQFASIDTPVTVGLVVDNSGSMLRKRAEVISAGLAFARESNPNDRFFVINFNNSVVRGLPERTLFTDNLQQLRNALFFGQPKGQTALYDAVAYALRHLEFSHQERRALIVVSDGGDNVSQTSFRELMHFIEASRATIYTVGLFDPEANDLNPGVLRRLAGISGGEYFQPTLNEVLPVFDKISRDIRNRYTLAFVPDEVNDKRSIRIVKVTAQENGRKLSVRTRTTYTVTPFSQLVAKQ
jgi:Ca-activated chloride channel homolog